MKSKRQQSGWEGEDSNRHFILQEQAAGPSGRQVSAGWGTSNRICRMHHKWPFCKEDRHRRHLDLHNENANADTNIDYIDYK